MSFVQIIKVMGVSSPTQFIRLVLAHYPQARIQGGPEPQTMRIVVPDLTWSLAPGGDKDFFCALSRMGMITNYEHRRYSEWDREVRA